MICHKQKGYVVTSIALCSQEEQAGQLMRAGLIELLNDELIDRNN